MKESPSTKAASTPTNSQRQGTDNVSEQNSIV